MRSILILLLWRKISKLGNNVQSGLRRTTFFIQKWHSHEPFKVILLHFFLNEMIFVQRV